LKKSFLNSDREKDVIDCRWFQLFWHSRANGTCIDKLESENRYSSENMRVPNALEVQKLTGYPLFKSLLEVDFFTGEDTIENSSNTGGKGQSGE
jgi:hypothetical protein